MKLLGIIVQPELTSICNSRCCPWDFLFLFQFCDVAKVVIIHKTIKPNLAIRKYESKNVAPIYIFWLPTIT